MTCLFRRVRHSVNDPLHIAFYGRDRRFQIMRNVTDELFALLVKINFLLRRYLQSGPHLLEILEKRPDLIYIRIRPDRKIQISVSDLSGGGSKLIKRRNDTFIYPVCHTDPCQDQYKNDQQDNIRSPGSYLDHIVRYCRHHVNDIFFIADPEIQLSCVMLSLSLKIIIIAFSSVRFLIGRKILQYNLIFDAGDAVKINIVPLSQNDVRILLR